MFNFVAYTFKIQKIMLENAVRMNAIAGAGSVRLLRQHGDIFRHGRRSRRAEDNHAKPKIKPCGPDLTGHYGKRCRDVDVERI
jgi:hypothetical protein